MRSPTASKPSRCPIEALSTRTSMPAKPNRGGSERRSLQQAGFLKRIATGEFVVDAYLRDVAWKDQREKPVNRDAHLAIESRYAQEVVRPPQPPRGKTREHEAVRKADDPLLAAERRHRPERLPAERARPFSAQRSNDVLGQQRPFANGVLRRRRIEAALWIGNPGAIAERPHAGMLFDRHVAFHEDAAVARVRERQPCDERRRSHAGAPDDSRRVDAVAVFQSDAATIDL